MGSLLLVKTIRCIIIYIFFAVHLFKQEKKTKRERERKKSLKIPKGQSEIVIRRRTYNAIAKRKGTKMTICFGKLYNDIHIYFFYFIKFNRGQILIRPFSLLMWKTNVIYWIQCMFDSVTVSLNSLRFLSTTVVLKTIDWRKQ